MKKISSLVLTALFSTSAFAATAEEVLRALKVPAGFEVKLFQDNVDNARSLARGTKGTIFVSTRMKGRVYAIKDGVQTIVAKGLNTPNGIAFHEGSLYIAEVSRILRVDGIEDRLANPPQPVVVTDQLPKEAHHGWKFIAVGPDKKLYVPVGAPCNICERTDNEQFASILRMNLDGSGIEVFARGIRNTVGFDWHPTKKELWFTDNGRDMMGDNIPPCELNHAPTAKMHFGYPYCHGGTIADPEFGTRRPCSDFVAPKSNFDAHTAPLGMRFADPNTIYVALHGSWNRTKKIGYQVNRITLKPGTNTVEKNEPFLTGFLQPNEQVLGRPVDVLVQPDGSILVSDDDGDRIFIIRKI